MTEDTNETASFRASSGQAAPSSRGESMIDRAVETARASGIKTNPAVLKVISPAKVNLHLGVGPTDAEGFHEVETILHALAFHDVLYMQRSAGVPGEGLRIQLTCTFHGGITPVDIALEDNLAAKAVLALAEELGREVDETITILLEKRIPVQAGLGGGSSNAAAALVAASHAWNIPADDPRIETVARRLGSDVAFFLRGGCGLYDGRGDRFVRQMEADNHTVVLVKPDAGVSTAQAYASFDARPAYADECRRSAVQQAKKAADVALFNNLAAPAEQLVPELRDIRVWLEGQPGVTEAMLSGSGSATFALCDSFDQACAVATAAQKHGWWSRTTALSKARAMVVPR